LDKDLCGLRHGVPGDFEDEYRVEQNIHQSDAAPHKSKPLQSIKLDL
jgi:hypothetical protein